MYSRRTSGRRSVPAYDRGQNVNFGYDYGDRDYGYPETSHRPPPDIPVDYGGNTFARTPPLRETGYDEGMMAEQENEPKGTYGYEGGHEKSGDGERRDEGADTESRRENGNENGNEKRNENRTDYGTDFETDPRTDPRNDSRNDSRNDPRNNSRNNSRNAPRNENRNGNGNEGRSGNTADVRNIGGGKRVLMRDEGERRCDATRRGREEGPMLLIPDPDDRERHKRPRGLPGLSGLGDAGLEELLLLGVIFLIFSDEDHRDDELLICLLLILFI